MPTECPPSARSLTTADHCLLALSSALGRSFRASGNYYCDPTALSSEGTCPLRNPACEGQIVRLERAAATEEEWTAHVVPIAGADEEDRELEDDGKVEL